MFILKLGLADCDFSWLWLGWLCGVGGRRGERIEV